MKRFMTALAVVFVAAGMALAADAPLKGFTRDGKDDLFGYYSPSAPVKVGKFELDHLHIGMQDDLVKWEKGTERLATYAPVMFQFTDTSSKMVKNEENGQMYHANLPRVLPTAYRIQGNNIAWTGTSKEVGAVSFTGTIDRKKIAAFNAKQGTEAGPGDTSAPVIKGDLTVAGKAFKNITFTWSGGD
ncbi:MAG: hypothetical protein ISS15_11955 [Alphaproteobacteria bacterium]|nr:hypothetical protein [Alphaproteobacteria bacterium]MBL6936583.1 hypothetical protein [Alphaproteobacteria bacterium]MBL7098366.1 hypothetical protein [Alphaproteobacteria bacterium]